VGEHWAEQGRSQLLLPLLQLVQLAGWSAAGAVDDQGCRHLLTEQLHQQQRLQGRSCHAWQSCYLAAAAAASCRIGHHCQAVAVCV
jgi:hypothetical protein